MAAAIGATAVAVGPLAQQPAGAAITAVTSGGSIVVVNATGNENITPGCSGSGKATINGVVVDPPINCSAVTQLTVAGDAGNQSIYGNYLDAAAFSSHPRVVASMGDGADFFTETSAADNVDMGPGNDTVDLHYGGTANTGIDLGAGTSDQVRFMGSPLADSIVATSVNAFVTITQSNPDGGGTAVAGNAESIAIQASDGNDTINTTGITATSTLTYAVVFGERGDDTLIDGQLGSYLYGGPGTNVLTGGSGHDSYWSESDTDTLNGGNDGVDEYVYDTDGLRSGGRTLNGFQSGDNYVVQAHQGDVTMRVRPGTAGTAVFTTSLTRTGQQVVPASVGRLSLGQSYVGALPHKGLADVVATNRSVQVTLPSTGGGLLDVTIPSGAWETTTAGSNVTVASGFGQISASSVEAGRLSVHGPWTDKTEGFVHRTYRDLLFRFLTDTQRDQIADQIAAGTKTRAAVTAAVVDSDEYRGLDVDRVFLKYLRRVADPGGRTYWINSIRNGKALWRFRAQLFGSNEYFSKAGGSNGAYVEQAYEDVLGRKPDPSGKTYWTNKLDNGADRGSVALQFINSPEARRRLVDDQFLRLLDRKPTTAEQTTWVNALPGAHGEQDLIAALVSGSTYFNRS